VNVGEAPMVVRIERSETGRNGEVAGNANQEANLNMWVECVKMLEIKNGNMEVFEI
jgi:hypothetical protein